MAWLEPWWWIAALCGLLLLQLLLWWARRAWARWRARAQSRSASRAERRAVKLLRREGFAVEAVQPTVRWPMRVDGRERTIELRADYLVARRGERFVAEVKSGRLAPRLSNAATRRQLLEYSLAYDAAGVLLVDMSAGRIHKVSFPVAERADLVPTRLHRQPGRAA